MIMDKLPVRKNTGRGISTPVWIIVLVVLLGAGILAGFLSVPKHRQPTGPLVEVTFLNGNLGGGVLITYPNHKQVLVNPGPPECADNLITYLGRRKTENLTIFLCDTALPIYGAVDSLVDTFSVSQVVIPEGTGGSYRWKSSLERIRERGIKIIEVSEGDSIIPTKNSAIQIIAPIGPQGEMDPVDKIVGRLVYGNVSFLLASVLESNDEAALVESNHLVPCNVVHLSTRSYRSASLEFLSQIRPEYCVISRIRSQRSPSAALLQRIDPLNTGAELLQATQKTSVIIRTDGNEINAR